MPANRLVRISRKRKKDGWITVTRFDPQPKPANLIALKAEIVATRPMISLLDMLKETDLRLNFTDVLKNSTAYETLDRSVLRPRLLLGLNGIGTNAGFQRMAGLQSGATAKDLAYVRRRYIAVDALRQVITIVADGIRFCRKVGFPLRSANHISLISLSRIVAICAIDGTLRQTEQSQ
jgi:Tn3 transposase DDE domain